MHAIKLKTQTKGGTFRKGHTQRKCKEKRTCERCKKIGHHTSICKENILHAGTKGAIAFQTVQAKINIPGKVTNNNNSSDMKGGK